ncbi:MAG: hypothetical protein WD013_03945 [Gemmatimonadota bacterium]
MNRLEPRLPLEELDPGWNDPGYWDRFQARVMNAVGPALAERRKVSVTFGSVMLSWSRLVVPLAAAAAAAAALLAPPDPELGETVRITAVEEVIAVPTDGGEPLPAFLHSDEEVNRDIVLFAVEGF